MWVLYEKGPRMAWKQWVTIRDRVLLPSISQNNSSSLTIYSFNKIYWKPLCGLWGCWGQESRWDGHELYPLGNWISFFFLPHCPQNRVSLVIWLSWNSLWKPGWPRTQRFGCLWFLSAEIKGLCHHCLARVNILYIRVCYSSINIVSSVFLQ